MNIFRDPQAGFEAFKTGEINFDEEFNARIWSTGYDFPAVRDGRIGKEEVPNGGVTPIGGWFFNTRRSKFSDLRIREAIGLALDFQWTNKNIMFSAYKRITSYFENTDMKAMGMPSRDELLLLQPFYSNLRRDVFGDAVSPPISDGSGSDRILLHRASGLLREAGCILHNGVLHLPDGAVFEIEILNSSSTYEAQTGPFISNLRKIGIDAQFGFVNPAQFIRRRDVFDFDLLPTVYVGSLTPGPELRSIYSSEAARAIGSRNVAGISDAAVDALVERMTNVSTRDELIVACRTLDRILRANCYWVPMWYREKFLISYWDEFSRPDKRPAFGLGAPSTWWWDERKARNIDSSLKGINIDYYRSLCYKYLILFGRGYRIHSMTLAG